VIGFTVSHFFVTVLTTVVLFRIAIQTTTTTFIPKQLPQTAFVSMPIIKLILIGLLKF
jgi:hypothetical protein